MTTAAISDYRSASSLGCGFVAAVLAGAACLFAAAEWPVIVIAASVAGILAARFGEPFWASIARRLGAPLLAKSAVVLSLALAVPYGWFLGLILYGLYGPSPRSCSTAEMFALLAGAGIVAPLAILLVVAIARFRAGTGADRRIWRAVSWLAVASLLIAVGTNWVVLFRLFIA